MNDPSASERTLSRAFVVLAAIHIPVLSTIGWMFDLRIWPILLVMLATAIEAVILWRTVRSDLAQTRDARRKAEHAAVEFKSLADVQDKQRVSKARHYDRIGTLLDRFHDEMAATTDILHAATQELASNADSFAKAATRANAQSVMAALASEDTAHKVNSAAHAGEELAATISEIGSSAAQSSRLAAGAVGAAAKTSATIDELAAVAQEISKVTDLINGIAGQTNLLALNATIEAARAGETGRGFAIVAQEVKALAGQTAAATQNIGKRIEAMQSATGHSVEAIQAISGTIRELDLFSSRIALAVEQQATAAREIAGNVNSAAESVGHVNGAIREIESVADNTARAAQKMTAAATSVATQIKKIREQVNSFKQDMRATSA